VSRRTQIGSRKLVRMKGEGGGTISVTFAARASKNRMKAAVGANLVGNRLSTRGRSRKARRKDFSRQLGGRWFGCEDCGGEEEGAWGVVEALS